MSNALSISKFRESWRNVLRRYPVLVCAGLLLLGGQIGNIAQDYIDRPAGYFRENAAFWGLVACCGFLGIAAVLWTIRGRIHGISISRNQRWLTWALGGSIAGALLCAGLSSSFSVVPIREDSLSPLATRQRQPVAIQATIRSSAVWQPNPHHRHQDPDSQPWRTTWEIDCDKILSDTQWEPIRSRSTLSVEGKVDDFLPGDYVEIYGALRVLYPATNPGAFDIAEHQRQYGKLVVISASHVDQVRLLHSSWSRPLQRIRGMAVRNIDRNLHRYVTHDHGPLAAALVFGQRQQVDWEDQQQLMATGTLHMLAISGMHVEIVAAGALLLCWLLRFSERTRLIFLLAVCLIYAGLAAGKPPVLRAAVLVMGFEVARQLGRKARLTNLLSLSAIVLFLIHAANINSVGVHLSFLAVGAIGVFVTSRPEQDSKQAHPLDRLLRERLGTIARVIEMGLSWLTGMLRLSFWVWLITCPLVWFHFNIVAPIAIPLNVAVSVPLGFSLLSGLVAGLLGNVPLLGSVAGWVCGQSLDVIHWLVDQGEAIRIGHQWLPAPPVYWIVIFYSLVALWLLFNGTKRRTELGFTLVALLCTGIFLVASGSKGFLYSQTQDSASSGGASGSSLAVNFLDVGHGTCVVLELPDGRVWVYDAGHMGASDRSHQEIASMLWHQRVSRIDRLIISHADADHYNAVRGLAERFAIGSIVTTDRFKSSEDPAVKKLVDYLQRRQIPITQMHAGDHGHVAGMKWEVLHPNLNSLSESDNADSLCLLLEHDDRRVLLPGDLDGTGMLQLLQLPDRPCHVLMAPHHGSLTRDPTMLLQWCQPELVVVSGNHRAARPEVLERYAPRTRQLAITFRDGAVRCEITRGEALHVSSWRNKQWQPLEDSMPMPTRSVATLPSGF